MKTIAMIVLAMLVCCSCNKVYRHSGSDTDVEVSINQTTNGFQYIVAHAPLSDIQLSNALKRASGDAPGFRLIVTVDSRVAITSAFPVLSFAEDCGLTNIILRLNQVRLPQKPTEIMIEMKESTK